MTIPAFPLFWLWFLVLVAYDGAVVQGTKKKLATFPLIPGDSSEARRRRRQRRELRRLGDDTTTNAEENPLELHSDVLYEGYGVHYVDLFVGCRKPQRVTVIVDTGSSVTGFPCSGCHRCGGDAESSDEKMQYHTDGLFKQEESECFETVASAQECLMGRWNAKDETCRASKHYSEGSSWEAFEAMDTVYTGGDHNNNDLSRQENDSFRLHFACQDSVTGLFETQLADGIMGMYNSPSSFWYQMYNEKKLEQQAFSLCFSEPGYVERTGTLAGAMVLGGADTRLHKTPMIYAQQMSDDGKYVLHLEKVYLQSAGDDATHEVQPAELHKVQIFEEDLNNGGSVILDSGTTATYLTTQLKRHFVQVFNSILPEDVMVLGSPTSSKDYELTLAQLEQLPTVVLQMRAWKSGNDDPPTASSVPGFVGSDLDQKYAGKSILVDMEPSHYLSRVEDDDEIDLTNMDEISHYRFNIYFNKSKGDGGVLGANFMRGHDVLFDIDNGRIGFASSDCEYAAVADDQESG